MKKRQALKIRKRFFQEDAPGLSWGLIDRYKPNTIVNSWVVFNKLSKSKRRELWTKWLDLTKMS
jgi:hypothetical protein